MIKLSPIIDKTELDIHAEQFGYNSKRDIKLLDI